jgi:RNA polymerase sigma-70 factor, ECF subfamily
MSRRSNFEALAVPHMAAAFTLAYWLSNNRTDADDIVQDAYVRAYRAFDSYHGDTFKPWLLAIVRNCAFTFLGQRRRASNVISFDEAFHTKDGDESGETQLQSEEPTAEQAMIAAGDRAGVMLALGKLPPLYREVLVLREIEEMSYRDISSLTGAPVGTVMSRLSRARDRLQEAVLAQEKKERYK